MRKTKPMPNFEELCEVIVWFLFIYMTYCAFFGNNLMCLFPAVVSALGIVVIQWINRQGLIFVKAIHKSDLEMIISMIGDIEYYSLEKFELVLNMFGSEYNVVDSHFVCTQENERMRSLREDLEALREE